ncbi:MAG: DUF2723 domain-containing protein [Dysgonamonadaceae bacterium]|jgi:hypothetical protein|nr:DUF2723 domain-containing protein [Dysgonamonadaceae bacterium]
MKKYKVLNNLAGWLVFAVAAVVYLLTIEPTASLWDCGEFIASAYKLEVGHPPGSPIFMMTANLFTQLVSDPMLKAVAVNAMSAVFSALTILFLFWTITFMVKKIIVGNSRTISTPNIITIIACGTVGALAYTFSDTFWFSAVESEVYAFSSLMTAVVVWLILKWEDVADEPHADRWLILIAYLMGISIAVHLLNLLCIPAIVLVYYFKKHPNANAKGSLVALLVSFAIVAVLLFGIIQGVVKVAGQFELLCVNFLGLPYNSGVALYTSLIALALVWGIKETLREKYMPNRTKISFIIAIALLGVPFPGNSPWLGIILLAGLTIYLFASKKLNPVTLNTILVGLLVITIGYSSYALIMIRSAANAPMDENSPEDIFALRKYLSREQYGDTPLIYGQTYVSEPKYVLKNGAYEQERIDLGPVWVRIDKNSPEEKDRYVESMRREKSVYRDELNMLFPRMYSSDQSHVSAYKSWANVKGKRVVLRDPGGESKTVTKPTFIENIRFFLNYQVNFMYLRYFMWNFAGRQNDIQGHGEVANGNWITGIKFIDKLLAGPQDNMPAFIAENKGHNVYYMLPLILGLLGVAFQLSKGGRKGIEGFWVTCMLFFMTGLAIVVYLNQTPYQPRERDYAYAGSFYAFCIWIGVGTVYVVRLLEKYAKLPKLPASIVGGVLCLAVPLQMVSQTWDDHDRSNRYTTRDFGRNYLTTCEKNAIIFTMGDNDTFPLWYAQEVEGYRTDVRVCNLSYLQTDWYIDQMKRQAYDSPPLPISWKRSEYINGKHDVGWIIPQTDEPWDVARALNRVKSDDRRTKVIPNYSVELDNVPTYILTLPVDRKAAIESGTVKPEYADKILDTIHIYLGEHKDDKGNTIVKAKNRLGKEEMMVLDMLSNNRDWKRPIYYAITVSRDEYVRLDGHFRQDGIAYRIVPYQTYSDSLRYDTDILYDNLMNKYRWGNLEQPGLYIDENTSRLAKTFRTLFGTLGNRLVKEGEFEKAIKAMDYAVKSIPTYNVPLDFFSTGEIAKTYFLAGDTSKAKAIYDELTGRTLEELEWYSSLNRNHYASVSKEIRENIYILSELTNFYKETDKDRFDELNSLFLRYYEQWFQFENNAVNRGGRRTG